MKQCKTQQNKTLLGLKIQTCPHWFAMCLAPPPIFLGCGCGVMCFPHLRRRRPSSSAFSHFLLDPFLSVRRSRLHWCTAGWTDLREEESIYFRKYRRRSWQIGRFPVYVSCRFLYQATILVPWIQFHTISQNKRNFYFVFRHVSGAWGCFIKLVHSTFEKKL